MRRKFALIMAAAAFGLLAFGAAPVMAATLQVADPASTQCPDADFTTIQSAVTAAAAGDTVEVCNGTYEEQVRIEGAAKDDLVLIAKEQGEATITYPTAPVAPENLVTIDDADDVTVNGFDIRGPYPAAGCAGEHIGIHVVGGSQLARIFFNRILKMQADDSALFGCQDGFGVIVEDAGQAALVSNDIRDYQKGGVVVDGVNAAGGLFGNVIAADDDVQPSIAPNGIQVSRGAVGGIARNIVAENVCRLPNDCDNFTGSGILPFEPLASGFVAQENFVFANDDNLPLIDTDGAQIQRNAIFNAGVLDGIFLDVDSTTNLIEENQLSGNDEHDCHDDSVGTGTGGTANTWTGNEAETANRAGICPGATVDPPPSAQAKASRTDSRPKASPAER